MRGLTGLTALQVMLMEALVFVLVLAMMRVEKLEMKVEFENFLLCLFLLEGKVMLVLPC